MSSEFTYTNADMQGGSMIIDIPDDWRPTADSINALPQPLRRYIHDLETRCDPAGDTMLIYELKEQLRTVEAMLQREREDRA